MNNNAEPQTIYGQQTLSLINDLFARGINRFSVIMRHSARHYVDDVRLEPFMSLTENGRNLSLLYGKNLPDLLSARFFSSYIGRCIETAYLIDKGFSAEKNGGTISNHVTLDISPFYILDFEALINVILTQETEVFIRNWINNTFPESVIMNAKEAASRMFAFMSESFKKVPENSIDILVTHDWNMFLLKEFGLGLTHEVHGKVEYLEGIVIFESDGKTMIANHQSPPKPFEVP